MLLAVAADGKHPAYGGFIRNQFSRREVVQTGASPAGTTEDVYLPGAPLAACVCDAPGARQDRRACCGTMRLPEYDGAAGLPTSTAALAADASLRA